MEELVKFFAKEGQVILQAWATFTIALVVTSGVIWFILRWAYSSQIANLESRLKLKEDQLGDYKNKLSGATPDEAKARLDTLEARLEELTPPRLTEEKRTRFRAAVAKASGTILVTKDANSPGCAAYASDFARALQDSGWSVQTSMMLGVPRHFRGGIALVVDDPKKMTPAQIVLRDALDDVGAKFEIQTDDRLPVEKNPPIVAQLLFTSAA